MRLFVAVLPPPDAAAELAEALAPLRRLPGADQLRWTEREGWHFTLAFLGEVAEGLLPELTERLGRAARRHPAHRLRLAGGGRFGDRALWAGATGERKVLARLAQSASAAGRRTGITIEERTFQAHLTLARSRTVRRSREGRQEHRGQGTGRGAVDLRPYARALASFEGTEWTVDALRLMSSTPGATGRPPRYDTVSSWSLGPEHGRQIAASG